MDDLRERVTGCVLGLALGDALGAPFEFRRRGEIPDPLPAFEQGWMGLAPGHWTDDTAMARNLCASLAERRGLDTSDVLRRHLDWLATDPPDVGNLTRRVLGGIRDGVPDAAERYVSERGPEISAGNGSVMYCAPLGAFRAARPELLVDEAPALSAITHWDERCRTACLAVTLAVAALVRGEGHRKAVERAVEAVLDREGGRSSSTSSRRRGERDRSTGPTWASRSSPRGSALQMAAEGRPFEEGSRYVVSLGGDTDTNAAVTGALLGALHGREALPGAWLEKLVDRQAIEAEAETLARAATA